MKAVEIVNKKYNISFINVIDFYHYFNGFYQKVITMYKNFKEILKLVLAPWGIEPSIFWLPAWSFRTLTHIHLYSGESEITLNPIPHKLWKDVITRVWAIMAHKEKMAYNTYKKATNLSKLVWKYIFWYLSFIWNQK